MLLLFPFMCLLPQSILTLSDKSKWMGNTDPSSFSNPKNFLTKHLEIKWNVDFDSKTVSGSIIYSLVIQNKDTVNLILDTSGLLVQRVILLDDMRIELGYHIGESIRPFGEPLSIYLAPILKEKQNGDIIKLEIHYETGPTSSSLAWLQPNHTLGKKHPYMFSNNQPINARSLLPCQDTPSVKSTFSATVSIPNELQCLMGAQLVGVSEEHEKSPLKSFKFEQNIPISSYLIAIAVGDIVSQKIGPRSRVWGDKTIIEKAAKEYSEVEKMISVGESLFGKYVWGSYDILIMPKNYPLLGMENPSLTFVPPFVVAGDKSMTHVIAHEIAHSWTGNLVTNHDWQHFWLNEGFTKYAERSIVAALYGEEWRQFFSIIGRDKLLLTIKEKGESNMLTSLVMDLAGVDPDEILNIVPYEKGFIFLYFLEQKVGGATIFQKFFHQYISNNSFSSVDSSHFKEQFIGYFEAAGMGEKLQGIEWDRWLYSPGFPPFIPDYDRQLVEPCTKLKNRWLNWNPEKEKSPFKKSDLKGFHTIQIAQFLEELINDGPQQGKKLEKLDEIYEISKEQSVQIQIRWVRIGIRSKWTGIIKHAFDFVNEYGQTITLRTVYKELYKWEEIREQVITNFNENRGYMMHVSAKLVAQDLKLD
ncbi:unnamed protein product [Orchesella dallaii]|uniref:Peptidase M1 leukotriene A4 hydrolase/aminopeptidase C-terminal domain-containing protein n=1 Tax=Orchesella dallaii TaxID=48710 RepID=A0ABP1RLI6_9HEXA